MSQRYFGVMCEVSGDRFLMRGEHCVLHFPLESIAKAEAESLARLNPNRKYTVVEFPQNEEAGWGT